MDRHTFYGTREKVFGARLFHIRNPHITKRMNPRTRRSLGSQATTLVLRHTKRRVYCIALDTIGDDFMRFQKHTMINVPLTTEELAQADRWIAENEMDVEEMLQGILDAGYKLSARYIDDRKAFCFTVTGTNESVTNASCSMSTWSGELSDAIGLSLWKVGVLFKFGTWIDRDNSNRRG